LPHPVHRCNFVYGQLAKGRYRLALKPAVMVLLEHKMANQNCLKVAKDAKVEWTTVLETSVVVFRRDLRSYGRRRRQTDKPTEVRHAQLDGVDNWTPDLSIRTVLAWSC